jgi:hypothetical protein
MYQASHRYSSVSQFYQKDNTAEILKNFIYLTFIDLTIAYPLFSAIRVALNNNSVQKKTVPNKRNKIGKISMPP